MKLTPYSQWIAQRPYIIAAFITFFLFLWMASGPSEAEQKSALKAAIPANNEQKITAQVKVETRHSENIHMVEQSQVASQHLKRKCVEKLLKF